MSKTQSLTLIMVLAGFIGMIDSAYIGFNSLGGTLLPCGPASKCHEVLNSSYSHVGNISIAWLGFLFYFAISTSSVFRLWGFQQAFRFTLVASLVAFLVTTYLLYIQAFVLQAFCDYCLLSAFLVMLILGLHLFLRPWKEN